MADEKKKKVVKEDLKINDKKAIVKKPRVIKEKKKDDDKKIKKAKEIEMPVEEVIVNLEKKSDKDILKTSADSVKKESGEIAEKKSTFNLVEVIIVMIITAFFGALVGAAVTYVKTDEVFSNGGATNNKYAKEFINTFNEINRDFYSTVSDKELIDAAIQGMIEKLGDPYSQYFNAEDAMLFEEDLSGEFIGMGAEITLNADGQVYIYSVFDNAPAKKAGIQSGDIIVKVNADSVDGMNSQQVANLIKNGAIGTKATVIVLRDGKEMSFEIIRGKVEIKSVGSEIIEKNNKKVGVLTIDAFNNNTDEQFLARYEEIKNEVDGLIIDVRNNGGGHLYVAKDIASLFLNKEDIVYQLDSKGNITMERAGSKKSISLPVVVIVNSRTASAAEILTAALKENLNIDVVGEKTYGKGTVQRVQKLSSGASIKYTINTWLTPNGNEIDKVGIEPTINISLDESYYENQTIENDNQLQKALDVIAK